MSDRSTGWATAAMLGALFFSVLAARLFLIASYASPLPFSDEWDAGALALYSRYYAGTLNWERLFAHHNEHRFLTSRLLGLAAFELAGGWNVRFQMVLNASLIAGFATWFGTLLGRLVAPQQRLALFAGMAVLFALPIDHEISLMGMNAHFYFLLLFSCIALERLARSEALGPGWWVGLAAAVLAYLSMASAAATPLVAIVVMGLQMLAGVRKPAPREYAAAALLALAAALMLGFVPALPAHDDLHPQSIGQFIGALLQIASFPLPPFGIVLTQAPLLLLAFTVLRQRPARGSDDWIALAIAGWVAAQMLSVAFNRAPGPVASRYLDFTLLGLAVGLAVLLRHAGADRWRRAGLALWVSAIMIAAANFSVSRSLPDTRTWATQLKTESRIVTAFLETGDPADLPRASLTYPNPELLNRDLSQPTVRAIIPTEILPRAERKPLDPNRLILHGGLRRQVRGLLDWLPQVAAIAAGLAAALLVLGLALPGAGRENGRDLPGHP